MTLSSLFPVFTLSGLLLAPSAGGREMPHPHARTGTPPTALDRYVAAADTNFTWKVAGSARGEGGEVFFLDMTSQAWLTTNEVSQPQWRHWVILARPDDLRHDTALLFISGGRNGDGKPPKVNHDLIHIARQTKSLVAELRMVPNQPLVFFNDGKERFEDDLIAFTWDKFLRTGDEKWPARLPMTKAAVRALDTITAFAAGGQGGRKTVDKFVVAGGSKRGWTTWTTAIVDRRVVSIAPIVIDMLNVEPSFVHHWQAYGFWAPAVDDYVNHGIMNWMNTPEYRALLKIEEPYEYLGRLTMPKLLINATGDQFFLPDSAQFYFNQLPGARYLRYIPNADHSLKETDAFETLLAWHDATLNRRELPALSWSHESPGSLRMKAGGRPAEVKLWQATNASARDFRLETTGPAWQATPLASTDGTYSAQVSAPEKGWTAYMVEFTYNLGGPAPLKVTTDVRVVPDTLPFPAPTVAETPKGFLSTGGAK